MLINSPSQVQNQARRAKQGYGTGAVGSSGFTGPLDSLSTGLFAAYSSRRLLTSFAGKPMRMRVDGGATEADISFNATYDDVSSSERSALLGSSDGKIVTFYDQTGLGSRDATQGTAGPQPYTKLSGSVLTVNSKQVIKGDGTTPRWLATPSITHGIGTGDFMVSLILRRGTLNTAVGRAVASLGSAAPSFYVRATSDVPCAFIGGALKNFSNALSLSTNYVLTFTRESGTLKCYVNGTQEAATHANSTSIASAALQLLGESGTGGAYGDECILEALFFTSVANRAAIIANQKTYAGL